MFLRQEGHNYYRHDYRSIDFSLTSEDDVVTFKLYRSMLLYSYLRGTDKSSSENRFLDFNIKTNRSFPKDL